MRTKIYFILTDENIFHPYFLLRIIKKLPKKYEVSGITIAKSKYKKGFFNALKKQYVLWGMIGFLYIVITSLLIKFLSKFSSEKFLSFDNISKKYKIPLRYVENVNDLQHLNYLRSLNIDIIISSSGQLFHKELLSIPKKACINRHASILPKYGGMMPVFWAMYFGEKEFGVSIHYMTEKFDQGDIVYQDKIKLDIKNSLYRNYIISFKIAANSIILALQNIDYGKVAGHFYHNDKEYFSFPKKEKIREFKNRGLKTFILQDILSKY